MSEAPSRDVSVVIVSWNARDALLACLRSLSHGAGRILEACVVDNASADGSAAAVRREFPSVTLLENAANEGFGRANNRALRAARGRYALLLNSDAELRPGALDALARHLDREPRIAVVGPRTRSADGAPQISFGPRLAPWAEWRQARLVKGVGRRETRALAHAERLTSREHQPDWVSASCLLARLDALRSVGFFDEDYFLYEEDADLCLRLRQAGFRIAFTPAAEVVHRLGASMAGAGARARVEYQRSHLLYYRKHNGALATLLLRGYLALRSLAGLLRRRERHAHTAILQMALRGPGRRSY